LLCDECRVHFCKVQDLLAAGNCKFHVDHRLVRGLDYYTRTVFEIRSTHLGSQDALAAGGRYDNLVQELGGPATPAVGFALGSERVIMAADAQGGLQHVGGKRVIFVAVVNPDLEKEAFRLATLLRRSSGQVVFTIEGPFAERSLKSQLRLADKLNAEKAVIFGDEEFRRGVVVIRDMKTQQQRELPLRGIEGIRDIE